MVYKDCITQIGDSLFSFTLIQKENGSYRGCSEQESSYSVCANKITLANSQVLVILAHNINDNYSIRLFRSNGSQDCDTSQKPLVKKFRNFGLVHSLSIDYSFVEQIGKVERNTRWKFIITIHDENDKEIGKSREFWFNRTNKKKNASPHTKTSKKDRGIHWHYNNSKFDNSFNPSDTRDRPSKKKKVNETPSNYRDTSNCNESLYTNEKPLSEETPCQTFERLSNTENIPASMSHIMDIINSGEMNQDAKQEALDIIQSVQERYNGIIRSLYDLSVAIKRL